MKALPIALALATLSPLPMLAAATPNKADIDARGTAPTFCTITNNGGAISMDVSAEGDKLSGNGQFSYIANGNSKVVLSAVQQVAPNGAAASTPSISLADLVSNSSSSAEAASNASGGVVRQEGAITASILQNNPTRLLTAGDYALQATATCTSL